jgi:hypothetical protein
MDDASLLRPSSGSSAQADSQKLRSDAASLRRKAEVVGSAEIRGLLIDLAEKYERLAASPEAKKRGRGSTSELQN